MLNQVSEKKMHFVRWVLAVLWIILIVSLFYDPFSYLMIGTHDHSPCVQIQGVCFNEKPYPIGTRVFWNLVIPSAVIALLIYGHEFWRRICPLYFFSQIPRALGLPPRLNIDRNQWLLQNHLYLQFGLLFLGLVCRILFINSNRVFLGTFLMITILSAILIVYLYGGRSWCHYVCPFGPVQTSLIGPKGLLESEAHKTPDGSITQSMCRTFDQTTNAEICVCIGCKSPCKDIDSQGAYWQELNKPGRKLFQYGYVGLVVGFFAYQILYAGNFEYYFSGVWHHQTNDISSIFEPGFYLFGKAFPIPKLISAPLTLAVFAIVAYWIFSKIEKVYRGYLKSNNQFTNQQQALHQVFTLASFVSFNLFFIYAGRGEILHLPLPMQLIFQAFVMLISTLWITRTWNLSEEQYQQESLAIVQNQPEVNNLTPKSPSPAPRKTDPQTEIKARKSEPRTQIGLNQTDPQTEIKRKKSDPRTQIGLNQTEPKTEIKRKNVDPQTEIRNDK